MFVSKCYGKIFLYNSCQPLLLDIYFIASFQNAGIKCIFNNEEIVSSCDLVFLCCLPSQIDMVAGSVVGSINKNTLICSFVTGVGLPRYVC